MGLCIPKVTIAVGDWAVQVDGGKGMQQIMGDGANYALHTVRDSDGYLTLTSEHVSVRFWREQCSVLIFPADGSLSVADMAQIPDLAVEGHGNAHECPICAERVRSVVFACGHALCAVCAALHVRTGRACPFCHTRLSGPRRLYLN